MSTGYDEQCPNVTDGEALVETLVKEHGELGDSVILPDMVQDEYDERKEIAKFESDPSIELPTNQVVQEDEIRSRHSSTSSADTAPLQENHEPIVELKQAESEINPPVDDEIQCEKNGDHADGAPIKVRPLLQRDFTQQSVVKTTLELDENDWAKKNIGSGKIKNLIQKFNSGTVLNEKPANVGSTYKSDYGVGQGKGHIIQDVFH